VSARGTRDERTKARLLSPPMRHLLLTLTLTALAACAPATPATPPQPAAPPAACPGKVEPADGLKEIDDPSLLKQALGDPGKGSLCTGKTFEAVKPVTVYRVWNKADPGTQLGRWWSFARPAGPVEAYRTANEICPEWSDLDNVSECKLKAGTHVVVGPGQSATCAKGAYPASPTNQVFVNNDTRDPANPKLLVDGCTPGSAWP
jgi:hypothetical protein